MASARVIRALLELLAHLAQSDDDRAARPRVLSPLEDLPLELLQAHQLAPLAYKAGYDELRDEYLRNALDNEVRQKRLADAVAALSAAEIPVMLLKGMSYVGVIYDDPAERPMSDIDLMVRPDHHPRAVEVLGELGYAPHADPRLASPLHHSMTLVFKNLPIDLHRTMVQPLRSRIDVQGIWDRALPAIERDDRALRLDPVDEATLHLVHIARHELMVPALAYLEAQRLLRRRHVTRERVDARARSFRLSRAVGAAADMSAALAGGHATTNWSDRLSRVLPSPAEVLGAESVTRRLQLLRKTALLEGPRELGGLVLVAALERMRR
jgi:hypothetical protein